MNDNWINRWDERYRDAEYAYGVHPNNFFKACLSDLKPGKILFPAEGEGRNAVYAAQQGWQVSAFDISIEGKNKALQLAKVNQVTIDYQVGELPNLDFQEQKFDVIALIYAHFPAEIRSNYHRQLNALLEKNGMIIFEAFSKNHLEWQQKNEHVGGPKDQSNLFSVEEIKQDFPDFSFKIIEERVIELNEGIYHQGTGSAIRFLGQKK